MPSESTDNGFTCFWDETIEIWDEKESSGAGVTDAADDAVVVEVSPPLSPVAGSCGRNGWEEARTQPPAPLRSQSSLPHPEAYGDELLLIVYSKSGRRTVRHSWAQLTMDDYRGQPERRFEDVAPLWPPSATLAQTPPRRTPERQRQHELPEELLPPGGPPRLDPGAVGTLRLLLTYSDDCVQHGYFNGFFCGLPMLCGIRPGPTMNGSLGKGLAQIGGSRPFSPVRRIAVPLWQKYNASAGQLDSSGSFFVLEDDARGDADKASNSGGVSNGASNGASNGSAGNHVSLGGANGDANGNANGGSSSVTGGGSGGGPLSTPRGGREVAAGKATAAAAPQGAMLAT